MSGWQARATCSSSGLPSRTPGSPTSTSARRWTAPGVIAAFTGADLAGLPEIPPSAAGLMKTQMVQRLLATDKVRFVGEPVAVVVTEDPYQGEDAIELVEVDYDPLPAALGYDPDDASLLFEDAGTNVAGFWGDPAALKPDLFEGCEVVVSATIINQRVAPAPMETRAAAAVWGEDGRVTAWIPNQGAQGTKAQLATMLGCRPEPGPGHHARRRRRVRREVRRRPRARGGRLDSPRARPAGPVDRDQVREPHRDDARPGPAAHRHHRRPPGRRRAGLPAGDRAGRRRLPEDRRRAADAHHLDDHRPVQDPATPSRSRRSWSPIRPRSAPTGARGGPRRPPRSSGPSTCSPPRSALDPADVRRKNLLAPFTEPHRTAFGALYDTGDYVRALDKALHAAGYAELRAEQARRRASGDVRQLGIGLASYVEITGMGDGEGTPPRRTPPSRCTRTGPRRS